MKGKVCRNAVNTAVSCGSEKVSSEERTGGRAGGGAWWTGSGVGTSEQQSSVDVLDVGQNIDSIGQSVWHRCRKQGRKSPWKYVLEINLGFTDAEVGSGRLEDGRIDMDCVSSQGLHSSKPACDGQPWLLKCFVAKHHRVLEVKWNGNNEVFKFRFIFLLEFFIHRAFTFLKNPTKYTLNQIQKS